MCHAKAGSGWLVASRTTSASIVRIDMPSWRTSCTVSGRQDSLKPALESDP